MAVKVIKLDDKAEREHEKNRRPDPLEESEIPPMREGTEVKFVDPETGLPLSDEEVDRLFADLDSAQRKAEEAAVTRTPDDSAPETAM
jgi:hypothetical protein